MTQPNGKCLAPDCANSVRSKFANYCETHYYRLRRGSKAGLSAINKTCLYCTKPLERNQSKYCSDTCQIRSWRGTPSIKECLVCSKSFPTQGTASVCSSECRLALLRANEHKRRAKIRSLPRETFSAKEIFERDRWICQLCGKKTDRRVSSRHPMAPSLDHIVPIRHGGGHTRANTHCTHLSCNFRKQSRIRGQMRLFG